VGCPSTGSGWAELAPKTRIQQPLDLFQPTPIRESASRVRVSTHRPQAQHRARSPEYAKWGTESTKCRRGGWNGSPNAKDWLAPIRAERSPLEIRPPFVYSVGNEKLTRPVETVPCGPAPAASIPFSGFDSALYRSPEAKWHFPQENDTWRGLQTATWESKPLKGLHAPDQSQPMKKSPWRVFAAACIVAAGFCFVTGMFIIGLNDKSATERDFIEYWAAGHQLLQGANPYDVTAVFQLERAVGLDRSQPKITFSPPVAFFLALPLGFFSAKTGLILWLLVLLACLLVSIWILWLLNGRRDSPFHLFGYVFAPALACLSVGQLGIFFLLAVVLFLYLHESRPFLSGAVLLPCALKPHLFLPFAIVLLLWVVNRKAYRILAGFAVSLAASCALTLCFDLHVWSQYSQMMHTAGVLNVFAPTLSAAFRLLVNRNAVWPQFLPEAAGCGWALWYFWTRRTRWSWMDQGLLLLLVSAACTPYAWFTDEAMLLPAVLSGLYRAADSRRSLWPLALIAGVALIEVYAGIQITSMYYLWTVPAWLGWYLYATRKKSAPADEASGAAEDVA
jgi:hypothetical protein